MKIQQMSKTAHYFLVDLRGKEAPLEHLQIDFRNNSTQYNLILSTRSLHIY